METKTFSTEVGFYKGMILFINTLNEFIPCGDIKSQTVDLILGINHDEEGKPSEIVLKDTNLKTLCHVSSETIENFSKVKSDSYVTNFASDIILDVPAFLCSIWERVKSIAIEQIALSA